MGVFMGAGRWIVRGAVFTFGVNLALYMGWLNPQGNFVTNIIAGIAIFCAQELVSRLVVRG